MCLDTRGNYKVKGKYGWKLFTKPHRDSSLYRLCMGVYEQYPVNKWLKEEDFRRFGAGDEIEFWRCKGYYHMGFHLFPRKKDVDKDGWANVVVRKVEFKDVVQHGRQNGHRVIVARKIRILPEKKK